MQQIHIIIALFILSLLSVQNLNLEVTVLGEVDIDTFRNVVVILIWPPLLQHTVIPLQHLVNFGLNLVSRSFEFQVTVCCIYISYGS